MTQYPGPYSPPPVGPPPPGYLYPSPVDPRTPARRASILMFIVGGLMLALGACCTAGSYLPMDQIPPESAQQFEEADGKLREELGMGLMQFIFYVGLTFIVPAILYLVLGFFVRGGGLGSVVTAMVVTVIMMLLLLISMVSSVVNVAREPSSAIGLCVMGIPLVVLSMLMYFLIGAARAAPKVAAMSDQMQSQYWQYQQNQQAYGQPGYEYPPAQGGVVPSMQPPPPPPTREPSRDPPDRADPGGNA